MSKIVKKSSTFIDFPQRCEMCGTTLTLYPKGFAPCPHCQKKVCRQCWGGVWSSKSFAAETCSHKSEDETGVISPVGQQRSAFQWDWQRALFVLALGALALGILVFLLNLFIF